MPKLLGIPALLALCLLLASCFSGSDDAPAPVASGSSGAGGSGSSASAALSLPQTGQTNCYNAAGNPIACAGTGQDGDLLKGVAHPASRFTDNGDGTVTDNLTGLMWMTEANCIGNVDTAADSDGGVDGRVYWQTALDYVAAVNTATYDCNVTTAHTDWRLPNRKELWSLVDLGQTDPALSSGHPFTGVVSSYYWSSSTVETNPRSAWNVFFYYGNVGWDDKDGDTNYVWPVRAGQ